MANLSRAMVVLLGQFGSSEYLFQMMMEEPEKFFAVGYDKYLERFLTSDEYQFLMAASKDGSYKSSKEFEAALHRYLEAK